MQIPDRKKYDAKLIARFQKLSTRHRKELIEMLGFPPDLEQVPEEWWQKAEKEYRDELAAMFLLIFLLSARHHGIDQLPDGGILAEEEGARWSQSNAASVAELYTQTTRDIVSRKQQQWSEDDGVVVDEIGELVTPERIEQDLTQAFGPARDERVVHTSVTEAQTYGGEFAYGSAGMLSHLDLWVNRPLLTRTGPCKICKPLHLQPRRVWAAQFPEGPSAHPECVCYIRYYRKIGVL